ncbi:MAG: DUF4115 domain-containing protein [Gammaproteobacteria bacterium]
MNDASAEANQTPIATDRPGALLRAAREKQDLSVNDIYQRIHLEPRIIQAIEADEYDKISSPTYARGYLRTYAKMLGLDGDYIVSLYNADNTAPPPEILPEVKPPTQVSSSDKPVKAFTYLISLALVLLLLIWFQSNYIVDKSPSTGAASDKTQVPGEINNTDTNFDVVIHPEGWQSPPPGPESIGTRVPAPAAETASDSVTPTMQISESINDESQPQILPVDSGETIRTYSATGPDTIELTITDDSWIEIYDAFDQRIFMDLGKDGEQLKIKGTAPFSMTLGNAPGVSIRFNNETINPSYSENSGVARFQLPPEE